MSGNQNLTKEKMEVSSRIPQMLVSAKEVGDKIDGAIDETVALVQLKIENEKKHRLSNASPTYYCRCGNLIPEERREALPGVKICVACANAQQTQH